MANPASLFTQMLSLVQRSDFARQVRELKAERHAWGDAANLACGPLG